MQATLSPSLPALDDPSLYINRELSWLEFNRRVLEEAQDPNVPWLERLKFLAIFSSNLDEFFMVRVGGLVQKVQAGIRHGSGADRMPPTEQLERIHQVVRHMVAEQYECLTQEVLPALEREGIVLRGLSELSEVDRRHLRDVFSREIFPVLTPLAIDPGHPFPHLLNKSLNLAVLLKRPHHDERLFAVVQVPAVLPRFVQLPSQGPGYAFTALETVIRMHLPDLFPGMELDRATVFRVTRDSEYEIDDDEVEDLLKTIEEEVRKRRRGAAVRLEIEADAPLEVEQILMAALDLDSSHVYRIPGMLDLTGLFQIYGLPGYPNLRDPHFTPQPVAEFVQASNLWAAIRARDILVHHPYESFSHVVDFIEEAARDERVLAIKQTLYRTSSDSPIVRALQQAADNGKQVTALIELKARLDEERNILWARELEKAGVHVVFGFVGLKTHCKVALVVRREDDGIRRYVHLSTGNYNPQTARIYTDLGFFTCNPDFCEDVSALFNYLTGYCELPQWRKLVVAPSRLQAFMIEKIDQERAYQSAGREGRIIAKINGLLEPAVVQALYRASQAGVRIDLICRGICALRPGIPGISENIRVISIVDRFLEHSRIFYFGNGGNPEVYIGSADWMDRNLSRRVEVVFPIETPELKHRLIHEILATSLADNLKARELLPDGSYRRVIPEPGQELVRSQERFLALAAAKAARRLSELPASAPIPYAKVRALQERRQRNGQKT
ncbi:MAG: polyphosphate kinase 1 [Gemmataceae bacterium]|nr:polyphosphate kinase 1 [Gemmataceae bacterium]MDW8265451.1 polyphosphate kinase 1 [Gemmataceae bacterium]